MWALLAQRKPAEQQKVLVSHPQNGIVLPARMIDGELCLYDTVNDRYVEGGFSEQWSWMPEPAPVGSGKPAVLLNLASIDDANVFGELLRNYGFAESYGCYSCFDLIDAFEQRPVTELPLHVQRLLIGTFDEDGWYDEDEWRDELQRIQYYRHQQEAIEIAWHWDGDGTLYVRAGDKAALNNDCKKDYRWEWAGPMQETEA